MRMTFSKRNQTPSETVDEVIDINVTPVMNMFVILIPFLVSMAVFTQLSIIEFTLPPNVGKGLDDSKGKPKLKITVVITSEYLAITRGENMLDSIVKTGDNYNYDIFLDKLSLQRNENEIKDEIIVAVRNAIQFKYVVKIMDICHKAGFKKIGLSSALEDSKKL
ncbi:MAG: biopolymer transporter ExbD [Chitinispirillia bacterium]